VIASTTDPGTPVVVPTPAYMNFFTSIRRQGREAIEVPMIRDDRGRWALVLPGIAAAIERSGAQLVILCNPHNPTGRVFTREELEAFARMVEGAGVRVFADEIWAPIVFEGHRHIPYASLSETTAAHTVTA
ncbi:aminotransferase class I/II-fold pyridoxal phosphate-dependent enzyme, partial [Bacilli bacterium]